jgi:hypothetical protein
MNEHDPEERDPGGGGLESVTLLSICAVCRLIRRSGVRNAGTPWAAQRSRAVGGSSRMLLRLSGQRRLVAGVKIAAGA